MRKIEILLAMKSYYICSRKSKNLKKTAYNVCFLSRSKNNETEKSVKVQERHF